MKFDISYFRNTVDTLEKRHCNYLCRLTTHQTSADAAE